MEFSRKARVLDLTCYDFNMNIHVYYMYLIPVLSPQNKLSLKTNLHRRGGNQTGNVRTLICTYPNIYRVIGYICSYSYLINY